MARVIKSSEYDVNRHRPLIVNSDAGGAANYQRQLGLVAGRAMDEVRAQAQLIIDEARQQADLVLAEAADEAVHIKESAYAEGRNEGFRAGREEGISAFDRLVEIAAKASADQARLMESAQDELVDLALAVAGRVVSKIAEEDRTVVLDSVMQALDHLAESPFVKIRVHPDDFDLVSAHWAETRGPNYRDRIWEVVSDREIERGGCILDLEGGRIDAQLSTQVAEMGKALHAVGGRDDRD